MSDIYICQTLIYYTFYKGEEEVKQPRSDHDQIDGHKILQRKLMFASRNKRTV